MSPFWRVALRQEGDGHVAAAKPLLLVELVYHETLRVAERAELSRHWRLFQSSWSFFHNPYYGLGSKSILIRIERRNRGCFDTGLRGAGSEGSRPVRVCGRHGTDDSYAGRVDRLVI